MKNKFRKIIKTKYFHIFVLLFIVFIIVFLAGIVSLKYNVEGELNLPFYLSKISVISNVEGIDMEDSTNKWNLSVVQNNDIYLSIKKRDNYKDTEIIENIKLDNFNIEQKPAIGEVKILRPDDKVESVIFKNSFENEVDKIEYTGSIDSSIKDLKISNQGGLVVFRYVINNLGNYISNDDEQINHSELLKKINIRNNDLKFKVSFDIYIRLNSSKMYKSNINLELPIGDVVEQGIQSVEYDNLKDVIFKRI